MIRPVLAAAALAVALSACTTHDARVRPSAAPRYASLDAVASGSLGSALSPEGNATPIAVLPAWIGRPTRLREREDGGVFEQAVSLDLAARGETRENLVLVATPRSDAARERLTDGTASVMGRPTEAGIRAEIAAAFPNVAMQVVTRPAVNTYGSYGLAVGRSARGARCLYAWQWIEDAPVLDGARAEPVSVRLRLCRDDVSLDAMAAAMNQLRLVPRFTGEAVAANPAARPAGRPTARATAARRPRPEATPRDARPSAASPRAEASPRPRPAPASDRLPERTARRYLGDDVGPVGPSAIEGTSLPRVVAAGGGAASAPPAGITADLPPEAYRGPASRP